MKNKNHKWTEKDDIIMFYLYKFGTKNIKLSIEEIGEILNIKPSSIKMRIGNFKAIDTQGKEGLKHYAKLSKKIYEKYKNYLESDLRNIVISLLKR
jgi:hypothetical protein